MVLSFSLRKKERNRKLAADVSSLKRQLESQSAAQASLQQEVKAWEAKASSAIALADRLEGDLAAVRHGVLIVEVNLIATKCELWASPD